MGSGQGYGGVSIAVLGALQRPHDVHERVVGPRRHQLQLDLARARDDVRDVKAELVRAGAVLLPRQPSTFCMRESWPSRRAAASSGAARRASLAPEMVRRASSAPGMGVDPLAGLVAGLAARRCASECVAGLWSAVADAASKSIDAAVLPSGVGIFSSVSGRVIDHKL